MDGWMDGWINRKIDRPNYVQADRIDRQADRQTDR